MIESGKPSMWFFRDHWAFATGLRVRDMDERDALAMLGGMLDPVGDDAAVFDDHLLSIDMLHEKTDFPVGTSKYTAGWRSVGASLSDIAAMGGRALAAVATYGAPSFEEMELRDFIRGACDVCDAVGAEYVGGDLDQHQEFTVATSVYGVAEKPIYRNGATPGEILCVTGEIGRTAAAIHLFDHDIEGANDLFRFLPRIRTGLALAPYATSMIDSSDGLARSLHQLAKASSCGFSVDKKSIPVHEALPGLIDIDGVEYAIHYGEDFELVFTVPEKFIDDVFEASPETISQIGTVDSKSNGITLDDRQLPDRGYTHGGISDTDQPL